MPANKPIPTILLIKRGTLTGWTCTEVEVKITGLDEKWCPYDGDVTLTRYPSFRQKISIFLILLIGKIKRDKRYRQYVEKWIDTMNKNVESQIEKHRNDPWGFVEDIAWQQNN